MRGLIDNSVNLGGDQTITGAKTFQQNNLELGVTPDSTIRGAGIVFTDKNGVRLGKIEPLQKSDGSLDLAFSASNLVNDSLEYSVLHSRIFSNGTKDIQTTAASATDNTVVTTVSHKYTDVNNIKFGNELIIQWGKTDTPRTVTFSTPYNETPTVLITQNRDSPNERNCVVNTITTTSFKTLRYGNESAGNGLEWFSIGI